MQRLSAHSRRLHAISTGEDLDLRGLERVDLDFSCEPTSYGRYDRKGSAHDSLLTRAVLRCNVGLVKELIGLGASVDKFAGKYTALMHACRVGRVDLIEVLLGAGANPNCVSRSCNAPFSPQGNCWRKIRDDPLYVATPLEFSVMSGNEDAVLRMLDAEARVKNVNVVQEVAWKGMPTALRRIIASGVQMCGAGYFEALRMSCYFGEMLCFNILLSNADFQSTLAFIEFHYICKKNSVFGHSYNVRRNCKDLADHIKSFYLTLTTPLHFLEFMTAQRARNLLRAGWHFDHREKDGQAPFEIAQKYSSSPASAVVLLAAGPWSPKTHDLLPREERKWVVDALIVGHQLARRFGNEAGAFADVWRSFVLPHAGRRAPFFKEHKNLQIGFRVVLQEVEWRIVGIDQTHDGRQSFVLRRTDGLEGEQVLGFELAQRLCSMV
jgi:hypothetical protein